ncbi:hypothetical protein M9H77_22566 [Catharanthus roseus]|uniref:Uncharacterized protein n=1 Tax=Catharanthus roseus TaxID=4058 RepID=A0ACC0ATG6_CATRO|nr:hypothetical protein M9H77_22566 [Catharanthus roseus]
MEDIDEDIEEGSEGEHNAEGKGISRSNLEFVGMTPSTGLSQGRKRIRAAPKGALSLKTNDKKEWAATPPSSAPLKANNALNKHFYTKTVELRMVELIDKSILAEKNITQESLEQYNVMELLLGMGCVALVLFVEQYIKNLVKEFYANLTEGLGHPESPSYGQERAHLLYAFATRKKINICTVIFRNIRKQIDRKNASEIALPCPCLISEYLLGCKDISLPSD